MVIVRHVQFFPPTGWEGRPWVDDPACDALVKSGRRVAESYSRAIEGVGLVGNASEVRVLVRPAGSGGVDVAVDVHLDFRATFETAMADVPVSVIRLGPQERAEVALGVLTGVMRALAPTRGWAPEGLAAAEAEVRDHNLEFVWRGPWKASPDRHRQARGLFWLEDRGHGRAVIEVRDRNAPERGTLCSADASAFCTAAGFKRSAETLQWVGTEVVMTPSIGLLGQSSELLRFTPTAAVSSGCAPDETASGPPEGPLPNVVVTRSRDTPETHEIRLGGGGPTNGVPPLYLDALHLYLERLGLAGQLWWSAADRNVLDIQYVFRDGDSAVKVRRLADRVTAVIHRSVGSFAGQDGAQMAHDDVRALVTAVSRRMQLITPADMIDLLHDDNAVAALRLRPQTPAPDPRVVEDLESLDQLSDIERGLLEGLRIPWLQYLEERERKAAPPAE